MTLALSKTSCCAKLLFHVLNSLETDSSIDFVGEEPNKHFPIDNSVTNLHPAFPTARGRPDAPIFSSLSNVIGHHNEENVVPD